jgi:hypothetical protein
MITSAGGSPGAIEQQMSAELVGFSGAFPDEEKRYA